MADFSLVAAFLAGLLGGVHCIGMCGSIVGALTAQLPRSGVRWPFHFAYNAGRLASYAAAGAMAGALGQAGLLLRDQIPIQHLLFALSSLMLVLLGLYLAGAWFSGIGGGVRHIEQFGGALWRRIQPLTRGLLPVTTPSRALLLGALWGWLPCGLVYSVLVTALASGQAQNGALVMLAFGLGTLPNLLAIGLFWDNIRSHVQSPRIRLLAGLLVAGVGIYGLFKVGYVFFINGWEGSCHVAA